MGDLESLLPQIGSLMQWGGLWHARAVGSNRFAKATTPLEAVRLALAGEDASGDDCSDDCSDLFA